MPSVPVRLTTGRRSRESGTQVGIQLNIFGLNALQGAVNGNELAKILMDAAQPMYTTAYENWPKKTGASADSIELVIVEGEEAAKRARIVLQAGGQKLENDPRNKSGVDYAPFLEFGTNGRHAYGAIRDAVYSEETDFKLRVRERVADLIRSRANAG